MNASSENALQVVCAWPVSGQYGPGSRMLYYVLVAACVFARKVEWLRNACLAAALLLPAVAALHAIILAAWHVDGAIDMDIYGAFQLCSIGILAAPVTARMSRTYFYGPGRNAIFIWTILVLAGLLSLAVEFYRLGSTRCTEANSGIIGVPISPNPNQFPYDRNPSCGMVCNTTAGPFSPMRGGSANNIYVIPVPDVLTFGAAMLLAAACCIPGILSLISIWNKIIEVRFGRKQEESGNLDPEKMRGINEMIRAFLSVVEVPVFAAAILGILIVGEKNFWSAQVRYQVEPIATVGQWSPIAGTGLALLGSLYLLLGEDVEAEKKAEKGVTMEKEETDPEALTHHCNCQYHHYDDDPRMWVLQHPMNGRDYESPGRNGRTTDHDAAIFDEEGATRRRPDMTRFPEMQPVGLGLGLGLMSASPSPSGNAAVAPGAGGGDMDHTRSSDLVSTSTPTPSQHQLETSSLQLQKLHTRDSAASRRKVARALIAVGNKLGTAAHDTLENSEFKTGKALDFPEIPGEENRNSALSQIRERYNRPHSNQDAEAAEAGAGAEGAGGHAITPELSRQHSRADTLREDGHGNGNTSGLLATPATPRGRSPHSLQWTTTHHPQSPTFPSSPSPQGRPHSSTMPSPQQASFGHANPAPPSSSSSSPAATGTSSGQGQGHRRSTLEVPSPTYHGPPSARDNVGMGTPPVPASFLPLTEAAAVPAAGSSSLAIVVSADDDDDDSSVSGASGSTPPVVEAAAEDVGTQPASFATEPPAR